jgi:hypothetical protein
MFPGCTCVEVLSQCLPDTSQPLVIDQNQFCLADYPFDARRRLFLSLYTAEWFLTENWNDPMSVLHFFVAEGFLPIADFKGGVIGLYQKAGKMGLGDTCLGYAEHGDHVFSDENRSDLNWDLAELMQLVVNRKREGVTNLSLDELLP